MTEESSEIQVAAESVTEEEEDVDRNRGSSAGRGASGAISSGGAIPSTTDTNSSVNGEAIRSAQGIGGASDLGGTAVPVSVQERREDSDSVTTHPATGHHPRRGSGGNEEGSRTSAEVNSSGDDVPVAYNYVASEEASVTPGVSSASVSIAAPIPHNSSGNNNNPAGVIASQGGSDSGPGSSGGGDPTLPGVFSSTILSSNSGSTPAGLEMSGNSDYHNHHHSSAASSRAAGGATNSTSSTPSSSSSSSRRQRHGLFGINLDLNFDPSSWLVPSNVAGRSISSSLSVLPDWVRHPVNIIPNRSGDNSSTSSTQSGAGGASPDNSRQSQQHHHHQYGAGGAASRLVSHHHHHHPSQGGANWNSASFQTSSSIPNNMHHQHHHTTVPLRTRHSMTTPLRSVDEEMDAEYNSASIDMGAANSRDHRGDSHSYVIDMDTPMGGWAEDDGPTTSQAHRGPSAGGGSNINLSNNPLSSSSDGIHLNGVNGSSPGGDERGNRRGSDINHPAAGGLGGAAGLLGGAPLPDGSPSMADAATGANERTRAAEILRDAPETRAFINEISRYTTIRPFIVINFLKGVFDYGTSILAFLALVVTFSHANSMVKKEVSKQRKRNLLYLTMIVINLMACVAFIYYIFNEMELYYALVFMPTGADLSGFWSLMWAVGVTDYVAKFGTVFVKIIVVSLPGCVLPFQKRGKFYLFIEFSSQLYRSFLPVYPWLVYLVYAYQGTARMFGLLLAGIYVVFKITDSVKRFKDWLKALEKLLSNVHYGTNPTAKQLDGAGTICPICHDNFANPTRLQCTHIFCEECVATWFDRERTCPMCRAKVVDDPTYRDGSTSQFVQLF